MNIRQGRFKTRNTTRTFHMIKVKYNQDRRVLNVYVSNNSFKTHEAEMDRSKSWGVSLDVNCISVKI